MRVLEVWAATGDEVIEKLYLLLADVGLSRTRILLAPSREPMPDSDAPLWVAGRYEKLREELARLRGLSEPE